MKYLPSARWETSILLGSEGAGEVRIGQGMLELDISIGTVGLIRKCPFERLFIQYTLLPPFN